MSYKINTLIKSDKVVVSYEKRLSICLTSNGFSFSITTVHDDLLAIGDVACNLDVAMSDLMTSVKNVFADSGIATYGLKEAELVVDSSRFVWVPQSLYDEKQQRTYLDAVCKIENGQGVYVDYNDAIKAYIVFSAPSALVSAFKIAIPGLKVRCQHDKMVNAIMVGHSDLKSLLLINLRDKESDYAVFCNKKLQLSNTFRCESYDDAIYHALNLTKQLHLEEAPLTTAVCGAIDRERFVQLRQFFPNVALYTGRQLTLTEPEMQHVPLYKYALILS